ncbi:hypothetical protein OsJ_30900 [Oryza sativa Japonica Group]|uniref:Uncharacterized protein n=3 Tax=Oryza sativa subsp. japonica TaxID=39947 RepID=B9G7S9_ORYSJ|nr:hypothetical protein OsJ_30900 [Oryza sativa Japonica Group]
MTMKKKKIHLLFNEVDLGAFTNCSSALGTLKPSRLVLRLFIDSETLTMMEGPSQTVLRTFIDLIKDLHKLFFSPSLSDDDVNSDGEMREVADEDGQEMVYCLLFRREENKKPLILDSMDGVD